LPTADEERSWNSEGGVGPRRTQSVSRMLRSVSITGTVAGSTGDTLVVSSQID
jgi:hypothetical protein